MHAKLEYSFQTILRTPPLRMTRKKCSHTMDENDLQMPQLVQSSGLCHHGRTQAQNRNPKECKSHADVFIVTQ